MECSEHSGKEEGLKAEGKNRGEMGVQGRRGAHRPREEDPGGRRREAAAEPAPEEVGDVPERGCGLEERAVALSIRPGARE